MEIIRNSILTSLPMLLILLVMSRAIFSFDLKKYIFGFILVKF